MSLKIYNAYKLPKFSFTNLINFNKSIKSNIIEIVRRKYLEHFSYKYISYVDDICVDYWIQIIDANKLKKSKSLLYVVGNELKERIKEIQLTNQRDPEVDWDVEIIYIPIKGKILCKLYSEVQDVQQFFEHLPDVKEYEYYDNTDRPKNVSSKQWKKRESDWKLALTENYDSNFMTEGMTYSFIKDYTSRVWNPTFEEILKYQPTYEERLKRITERAFLKKYYNDLQTNMTQEQKEKDGVKIVIEGLDLINNPDDLTKKLLNEYHNKFKQLLHETLTVDILEEKNNLL